MTPSARQDAERNDVNTKIRALRDDIDQLDEKILNLLRHRFERARLIGHAKQHNNLSDSPLRPNREEALINRLKQLNRSRDDDAQPIPENALNDVWRRIIAAAAREQGPIEAHAPKRPHHRLQLALAERFGTNPPPTLHDNARKALKAALNANGGVAAIEPQDAPLLAENAFHKNGLRIAARLNAEQNTAFLVTKTDPNDAELNDVTILVAEKNAQSAAQSLGLKTINNAIPEHDAIVAVNAEILNRTPLNDTRLVNVGGFPLPERETTP